MKLFLFDIDGTLLEPKGVGKKAAERAFEKMYGIKDSMNDIETHGLTDPIILNSMCNFLIEIVPVKKLKDFLTSILFILKMSLRLKKT